MSQLDYSPNFLDLEDAVVTNIHHEENRTVVDLSLKRKTVECPKCKSLTDHVHDYRTQYVKDLPSLGRQLVWRYRKRRYKCPVCGKQFYENTFILPRYHRITNRTAFQALLKLQHRVSEKQIAKDLFVSQSTVHRWMKLVNYKKPDRLPDILSIDEFKGNTDGEKFQCNIVDLKKKKIFDILPSRRLSELTTYFKSFSNTYDVKFIVMDMSKPYYMVMREVFPNATIIIDKFHVVRYSNWAFENVRKRIQKNLPDEFRKYFKHGRFVLLKNSKDLTAEQSAAVSTMFSFSDDLKLAYYLKEKFYRFLESRSRLEATQKLKELNLLLQTSDLNEYKPLITVIENWGKHILNAFDHSYTNGYIEGVNNSIKVLKRIAFGYRNFDNLRRRILHIDRNKEAS